MNVVLFGGSFNPPHLGHVIVVQQAFELIKNTDELWLLPDYQHSFAKNVHLAPVKHRLALTTLLLKDLKPLTSVSSRVRLETCNLDYRTNGQTIETIVILKRLYPDKRFSFLMGSDQLKSFREWHSWRKLLEEMPFYVYPRVGYPLKPLYPGMIALDDPDHIVTNLSSTLVRDRIKKHQSINHLVSPSVLAYLTRFKVYSL